MKDWEYEEYLNASESRFMREIEEDIKRKEKEKRVCELVKDKYGIDDYYKWESK